MSSHLMDYNVSCRNLGDECTVILVKLCKAKRCTIKEKFLYLFDVTVNAEYIPYTQM